MKWKDIDLEVVFIATSPLFWVAALVVLITKIPKGVEEGLQLTNWRFYHFGWPNKFEDIQDEKKALLTFFKFSAQDLKSKNPMRRKASNCLQTKSFQAVRRFTWLRLLR